MKTAYRDIYLFSGGKKSGGCAELPDIRLDEVETLPPIDKAFSVEVDIFYKDEPKESRLFINWITKEEGIRLRLMCYANDKRLKDQFRKKPNFLEKFINFLVNCSEKRDDREPLSGIRISSPDIPKELMPFVEQIKIWDDFLETFRKNNSFNYRYGTAISSDSGCEGYYIFVLSAHHLKIPREEHEDYWANVAMDELAVFDFNSKKNPPQIDDNCIWWAIDEKKVQVVLPHTCTNDEIVEYYEYQEMYNQFLNNEKKKEEEKKRMWKSMDENREKEEEEERKEKKQKKEDLRKFLLS